MKPGQNLTDQKEQLQDRVRFSPKAINQDGGLRSQLHFPLKQILCHPTLSAVWGQQTRFSLLKV